MEIFGSLKFTSLEFYIQQLSKIRLTCKLLGSKSVPFGKSSNQKRNTDLGNPLLETILSTEIQEEKMAFLNLNGNSSTYKESHSNH